MAVFIDLWLCLLTTKLSYTQLFKWGHSTSAYTKSLSINGVITAGDAGSKFLEECTVLRLYIFRLVLSLQLNTVRAPFTPPLWTDLVKILTTKPSYRSFFSAWCTDFKNVIFEKIPWAPSEVAKSSEVKQPRNPKPQKF
jgi:hypothetical protein